MPPQKHRRRWRRKGMCCMPMPRPCIDSMPRHCMPHCPTCRPCPSQHAAASSSSHSDCSCEEEKYCTIDNCKNAPMCISSKLRYCPYGFRDKADADHQRPDRPHGRDMIEYHPSLEREMRPHHPQAASTPYMQSGSQPAPEFEQSGYTTVPTISSIHSRSPDQFDQSMPQYAQQLARPQVDVRPPDAAQAQLMQQDFGPPDSVAQVRERMMPRSPESQAQVSERMTPRSLESQVQVQERQIPISSESQTQTRERMMPRSPEYQPQMQERMMPRSPESQAQMQERMIPRSPEYQPQIQERMMPRSPESQAQMQERIMPRSPESQAQMQERMMPRSPESQAQMQERMLPKLGTLPSPESDASGLSGSIRKTADHYQPYYGQPRDTMPSYVAPRGPMPQEEGYVNIPRAEKQVGGYTLGQYSFGPVSEDSTYPNGPAHPHFIHGQKYSLSAVSSADRMKPQSIIQDEPRRIPQYTSSTDYSHSARPPSRRKHGLIVEQPVSDQSYREVRKDMPTRYISDLPTSPAPSERIPDSRPMSTDGPKRTMYHPPYKAETTLGVPYQTETTMGVPYQTDVRMRAPYRADAHMGVPYQADAHMGAPYQADARMEAPYQADTHMGYQPSVERPQEREKYIPEVIPKKSVHHAIPDTIKTSTMKYDTELPISSIAPDRDDTRSGTTDGSRRVYQPMPSGYESVMGPKPTQEMGQSYIGSSRYPIGRPIAESTSKGSSRSIPFDYSAGPPLSPATSVRMGEPRAAPTDGLHRISYRTPSTGYNKFCKEPSQPEYVDKSIGFEYPVPQISDFATAGAQDEVDAPKCSCRYPPAFKHLECAGLMSGTCECNENDL